MADTPDRLLAEYRERFLAGERPDVLDYLARAGEHEDRLADLIDDFLVNAPPLDPHPEDLAAVRAIMAGEPTLAAQRSARGIRRKAVVDAIMERFGFQTRSRVERRYHELETGQLDPRDADPGLIEVIAKAMGVARSALMLGRPPQMQAATLYLRQAPPPMADRSLDVTFHVPVAGSAPAPATPPRRSPEAARIDELFGVGE